MFLVFLKLLVKLLVENRFAEDIKRGRKLFVLSVFDVDSDHLWNLTGIRRFIADIELMLGKPTNKFWYLLGYPVNWFWKLNWLIVTPLLLVVSCFN